MTAVTDLAEAFRRLVAGLAWLDDQQPDGKDRARGIREKLTLHLNHLSDGLAGKTGKCPTHPMELAHNCRCCRSERIGREPVSRWPAVSVEAAAAEARRLGEGNR